MATGMTEGATEKDVVNMDVDESLTMQTMKAPSVNEANRLPVWLTVSVAPSSHRPMVLTRHNCNREYTH